MVTARGGTSTLFRDVLEEGARTAVPPSREFHTCEDIRQNCSRSRDAQQGFTSSPFGVNHVVSFEFDMEVLEFVVFDPRHRARSSPH